MINHDKQVLSELSKEQLIYLIEQLTHSQDLISIVCVEESKWHIDSDKAVDKIRDYIYDMPSLYDADKLKAYIKQDKIAQNPDYYIEQPDSQTGMAKYRTDRKGKEQDSSGDERNHCPSGRHGT